MSYELWAVSYVSHIPDLLGQLYVEYMECKYKKTESILKSGESEGTRTLNIHRDRVAL